MCQKFFYGNSSTVSPKIAGIFSINFSISAPGMCWFKHPLFPLNLKLALVEPYDLISCLSWPICQAEFFKVQIFYCLGIRPY